MSQAKHPQPKASRLAGRRATRPRIRRLLPALGSALLLAFSNPALATSLPELWHAARQHDPALQSAQAMLQAGQAQAEQARALWRPELMLGAGVGHAKAASTMRGARFNAPGFGSADQARFDTDIDKGRSANWSLALTQPLYSPQRSVQQRLLQLSSASAELQWQAAQQQRMLQLAESYFAVALAERALQVLLQQQSSVDRLLSETRDRFDIGDLPVTDTHEARARAETIRAQVLAAQTELELRHSVLTDLTGIQLPAGTARLPQALSPAAQVPALESWQAESLQQNPDLLLQQQQVVAAREEASRHRTLAAASVDLVARVDGEHIDGDGPAGDAANLRRGSWVGVQLRLPLSTSGLRGAQEREALFRIDAARADQDRARLEIGQQIRAAWLGLNAGRARLQALETAATASKARLDATRLGQEVGDRTTLDLLNAENEQAAAQLAAEQARAELLLHQLQLDALAGRLNEASLQWAWQQTAAH